MTENTIATDEATVAVMATTEATEKGVISTDTLQEAEATEAVATPADGVSNADPIEKGVISIDTPEEGSSSDDEPETFPREYVEKLRKEAADNRAKAKRVDELAERLFRHQVAATGLLQDANDLPFDSSLLDDTDGLQTAIEALLATHPHYAKRTPRGTVGQGSTASAPAVSLVDMLRGA